MLEKSLIVFETKRAWISALVELVVPQAGFALFAGRSVHSLGAIIPAQSLNARVGLQLKAEVCKLIHKLLKECFGLADRILSKGSKDVGVDGLKLRLQTSVANSINESHKLAQNSSKAKYIGVHILLIIEPTLDLFRKLFGPRESLQLTVHLSMRDVQLSGIVSETHAAIEQKTHEIAVNTFLKFVAKD